MDPNELLQGFDHETENMRRVNVAYNAFKKTRHRIHERVAANEGIFSSRTFGELPRVIKCLIWSYLCPPPRWIRFSVADGNLVIKALAPYGAGVLTANQQFELSHFGPNPINFINSRGHILSVDCESDVLFFDCPKAFEIFQKYGPFKGNEHNFSKFRNVALAPFGAISYEKIIPGKPYQESVRKLLSHFPGTLNLYIVEPSLTTILPPHDVLLKSRFDEEHLKSISIKMEKEGFRHLLETIAGRSIPVPRILKLHGFRELYPVDHTQQQRVRTMVFFIPPKRPAPVPAPSSPKRKEDRLFPRPCYHPQGFIVNPYGYPITTSAGHRMICSNSVQGRLLHERDHNRPPTPCFNCHQLLELEKRFKTENTDEVDMELWNATKATGDSLWSAYKITAIERFDNALNEDVSRDKLDEEFEPEKERSRMSDLCKECNSGEELGVAIWKNCYGNDPRGPTRKYQEGCEKCKQLAKRERAYLLGYRSKSRRLTEWERSQLLRRRENSLGRVRLERHNWLLLQENALKPLRRQIRARRKERRRKEQLRLEDDEKRKAAFLVELERRREEGYRRIGKQIEVERKTLFEEVHGGLGWRRKGRATDQSWVDMRRDRLAFYNRRNRRWEMEKAGMLKGPLDKVNPFRPLPGMILRRDSIDEEMEDSPEWSMPVDKSLKIPTSESVALLMRESFDPLIEEFDEEPIKGPVEREPLYQLGWESNPKVSSRFSKLELLYQWVGVPGEATIEVSDGELMGSPFEKGKSWGACFTH